MQDVDIPREAAAYCGIPYQSFLYLTRQGKIPHMRVSKQKILYRRASLDQWMSDLEAQSVTAKPDRPLLRRAK